MNAPAPPRSLETPLRLPCGVVLPNRLAKSAMSEGLASALGEVTPGLVRLYRRWAAGGVGLLVTGNAVIDAAHLERPGNVVVDGASRIAGLARWAEAARERGAAAILQINHAGRQTTRFVNPTPVAPSAVAAVRVLRAFGRPRAATTREIAAIRAGFVRAARVAEDAGFSGVQIHAAHGYLLNQFLSPHTNRRTDAWGGSVANRARLLLEIVRDVREATRPGFAVTVKLNTADFQADGLQEDESVEVVRMLDDLGVDLLELSGGTYERGASFGEGVEPDAREAYFIGFARRVRRISRVRLLLTGGFRSAEAMDAACEAGETDVVGLGRPLALEPDLPRRLLSDGRARSRARPVRFPLPGLRGAAEMAWYWRQIVRMSRGLEPDASLSLAASLVVRLAADYVGARRVRATGTRGVS